MNRREFLKTATTGTILSSFQWCAPEIGYFGCQIFKTPDTRKDFICPPNSARPGVYWYFMDGNLSRKGMTADLESMKNAGIGNLIFLEVNVGVPTGPIKFMSESWQELFAHAVHEAERLGIDISLGLGPGWSGSGGPWVKAEQSMQHLVFSVIEISGPGQIDVVLPLPEQRSTRWHQMRSDFYEDVAVYAFPRCKPLISDINEKALYERNPYTSRPGTKPYLPAPAHYQEPDAKEIVSLKDVVDLTAYLDSDGRLQWDTPAGEWTIMRMGRRSTGASSRPAPASGLGFECDKLDAASLDEHFENYVGRLLKKVGPRKNAHGWTTLHMDSWESGAQNWTPKFCKEFQGRRGYDPKPYFPAYSGRVVESLEMTERFLWDVRRTCQELVLDYHAGRIKEFGRKHGFELSIEPYDMNPTADLDLGALADVPMGEFWSEGLGPDSSFSCIEASSIAHTMGRPIVSAEAFTAGNHSNFDQGPWSMKNQGDWAFGIGINRFVYHTFAHQPLGDEHRPGMTMGPYGVHWDRNQPWWPMVSEYHRYISRCSYMLRQGVAVASILYLTPEGAPHVFRPPSSALEGRSQLKDKKGFRFDGCSPDILMARADVKDGKIIFPRGTSYHLMVLPRFETMTPELLIKIKDLINAGAVVVGSPPVKSPSLSNYPFCDSRVKMLAKELWGGFDSPGKITRRSYGKGCIFCGGEISKWVESTGDNNKEIYPSYDTISSLLQQSGLPEDFSADSSVRFIHRQTDEMDLYFVSNRSDELIDTTGNFRVQKARPQLWHPVTGRQRPLPEFTVTPGTVSVPLRFEPYESYFIVFPRKQQDDETDISAKKNFPSMTQVAAIEGPWEVSFDPTWGAPETVIFETLGDWSSHKNAGIKYYSGIATYRKIIDLPEAMKPDDTLYLDLGTVHNIARIRLNGKEIGIVWTAPRQVMLEKQLKPTGNVLEIEVANTWGNRLVGDEQPGNRDVRNVKWDDGLLEGKSWLAGRYTFTTHRFFNNRNKADSPLMPSGLLGPVRILREE